jgi:hypothetical protein
MEGQDKMGRVAILICSNCGYKTHLTQAESLISHALHVACSKCGSIMKTEADSTEPVLGRTGSIRETLAIEPSEIWVAP